MASTKLAFLAIAVLLLQASWCAVSQHYAVMVWTSFEEGWGNGLATCDGQYHDDGAPIAALSPVWYADESRCFKSIDITSKETGKTARATVVSEVDGDNDNTVATTSYVWELLGFNDDNIGEVFVTWADA